MREYWIVPEEIHCFNLLDAYARSACGCFLAEFFKASGDGSYLCCFRPAAMNVDLTDMYACKYVTIDANQVQSIVTSRALPNHLAQSLKDELSKLMK